MHTPETLQAELANLGLPFTLYCHAPVFTVEEAQAVNHTIPGAHIKNLFLKDKAGALTLITALDDRRLDLTALAKHQGAKRRFSFGSAKLLYTTLGVEPGSVTPLGLINAPAGSIQVVLDAGIFAHALVNPHPLINNATLGMTPTDLVKALQAWGHAPIRLDLAQFTPSQ
jgi:Ala-tRNA(Pro) deacylase